jgi:hypothetical protein
MASFIDNVQADTIYPYLEKYGLTEIDPDNWYPLQTWLDVLNDMATGTNISSNMVAIGLGVINNMVTPPGMENATLQEVLDGWHALYHMQHRGENIGGVIIEKISDSHYKTIHNNVYPDDMTYGVAYGLARRYLPSETRFKVYYDMSEPHMDEGGKRTIIHIEW